MSFIHRLLRAKLRPLTQLLLLAGLAAAAFAGIGISVIRDHRDQQELSSQIKLGEQVLNSAAKARESQEELRTRLTAAQEELAAAGGALPSTLDGKEILETILARVGESQVRLLRIDTRPPAVAQAEGDEGPAYTVFAFDLEVEGDFDQVIALLTALEDGAAGTSAVGKFDLRDRDGAYGLSLELLAYARVPTAEVSPAEEGSQAGGAAEAAAEREGAAVQ